MKSKSIIIIVLICILMNILTFKNVSASILLAEQFEKLSIYEGISNEYITSIFQDSKGYMWIGTADGLNRYDGKNVKTYNADVNRKDSLSSTYINAIEEDDRGNIWIGTNYGLDILINNTFEVIRLKDYTIENYSLGELEITDILKSNYEENIMWVGTSNGLIKINIETYEVEEFFYDKNDSDSLTNSYITCLKEDKYKRLWVGTKNGINILDENSKVIYTQTQIDNNKLFVHDIESDSFDYMWVSTKEGIIIYDINSTESKQILILSNEGLKTYNLNEDGMDKILDEKNKDIKIYNNNFIMSDSKDNIWISSSEGIKVYIKGTSKITEIKRDENNPNSISSNIITCFYEDNNGVIWVGTDRGINILNENRQFNSSMTSIGSDKAIYDKDIVSIVQHNQYVWIATKFDGVYIYNEDGILIRHLNTYDNELGFSNRYVKKMFSINNQFIIITTNKNLVAIDTKNYTYTNDVYEQAYYSELNYLYNDGKEIWTATEDNFYSYNLSSGEETCYSYKLKEFNINPGHIKYIIEDYRDENILWLGGSDTGIVKYSKKHGVIKQYLNDSSDEKSLISNKVNCITFDNFGDLWVGTNMGLSKLDIESDEFTSYTIVEGLTNNFVNSILLDEGGNLWISTNNGLNKFNIETKDIVNFTETDGVYGSQFNVNSSLICRDGTMMFGNTKGVVYFKPNEIVEPEKTDDKVVIGDILIGKEKAIYDGNELILEYDDKDLSIDYFLPNYRTLDNITYEYMIEGIDSDWVYVDDNNNLSIKILKPGKYTLKIRARDGHGNLTDEAHMNIRVKNPIWKSPLACIIYVLIICAIVLYILNYVKILRKLVNQKTMKLNAQLEENKRLSEEIINKEKFKNNYFVNLSHELRTPINVISSTIQLERALSKEGSISKEKSNRYMNIISKNCDSLLKIINDIIDSSKIETGHYKINKQNNDIVYIVEEAALSMSKYIEEKGLTLIIDPDIEEKIISCDATEVERCVINLIGNAVKFTPEGGEIHVYIKVINEKVEITVEDTGIGISKEDQEFIFKRFSQVEGTNATKVSSSGIGLTLVKHIVELHNGYVKLESEINKGSKFTIVLPGGLVN